MQYAYRDRRNKKRDFKSLWIQRINAGVRAEANLLEVYFWIKQMELKLTEKF